MTNEFLKKEIEDIKNKTDLRRYPFDEFWFTVGFNKAQEKHKLEMENQRKEFLKMEKNFFDSGYEFAKKRHKKFMEKLKEDELKFLTKYTKGFHKSNFYRMGYDSICECYDCKRLMKRIEILKQELDKLSSEDGE